MNEKNQERTFDDSIILLRWTLINTEMNNTTWLPRMDLVNDYDT